MDERGIVIGILSIQVGKADSFSNVVMRKCQSPPEGNRGRCADFFLKFDMPDVCVSSDLCVHCTKLGTHNDQNLKNELENKIES